MKKSSMTYLIQKMNSDVVKKVKSDAVNDIDIQNEIMRLKDRVDNLETILNTRYNIIEKIINELLRTIKVVIKYFCCLFLYLLYIQNKSKRDIHKNVLFS